MERAARLAGAVCRAPVPRVSIHDSDHPSFSKGQNLLGVLRL
jgi:hypothetical protein